MISTIKKKIQVRAGMMRAGEWILVSIGWSEKNSDKVTLSRDILEEVKDPATQISGGKAF